MSIFGKAFGNSFGEFFGDLGDGGGGGGGGGTEPGGCFPTSWNCDSGSLPVAYHLVDCVETLVHAGGGS